ncbi:MAG: hypothetical protein EKK41_14805 [Hyphomicrobiales bacterium]|nr:MAG: hypothetical protein EKK41_14805 [Hyphomicrobiales bacterium]
MWEIQNTPAYAAREAILAHLIHNRIAQVPEGHRLFAETVPFYADTLLCCLVVPGGTRILIGEKKAQDDTAFYFLFRTTPGQQQFVPIAEGPGNIWLANRHLELKIGNDDLRAAYARFYFAFARTGRPPTFRHLPASSDGLRFKDGCPPETRWKAEGALWRFLDTATRTKLRIDFQRRGLFPTRFRFHAHAPVQYGTEIHDIDFNIWQSDGHVTDTKYELIYTSPDLAEEPKIKVGHLPLPGYITRRERWYTRFKNFKAALGQLLYMAVTLVFGLASLLALGFIVDGFGHQLVRPILETVAGAGWPWLLFALSTYCVLHFAATTFLTLDIERIRSSVLTVRPSLSGSWFDEWLYRAARRQVMRDRATRTGVIRRIVLALTFLATWLTYLVLVFTSLQLSWRPALAAEPGAVMQIITIFAQQAAQYIPMVFYFVGRSSLDPAKRHFVDLAVMLVFQGAVGLLVIRRIHRFWTSTSRAHRLRR